MDRLFIMVLNMSITARLCAGCGVSAAIIVAENAGA